MKETNEVRDMIVTILVIFLIVGGLRYVWAKAVYHDARCMWAECRINVNPK